MTSKPCPTAAVRIAVWTCLALGSLEGLQAAPRSLDVITPIQPVTHIQVSIADQAVAAFRGSEMVFRAPVSTGEQPGWTPLGAFKVSHKHEDWISTIYHTPMPFFLRLNGGKVGLHAGFLPGYPASHGCIRMTKADAETLFRMTPVGTPVRITPASTVATAGVTQPTREEQLGRPYRMVDGEKVYAKARSPRARGTARIQRVRNNSLAFND